MKLILLLIVSILNIIAWFDNSLNFENSLVVWFPFFSIILSLLCIFPKLKSGKIEIKLIYIFIAGALYFNSLWYFLSIFNPDELSFFLERFRISMVTFMKSNLLMGISLPLTVGGYIFKEAQYAKKKKTKKEISVKGSVRTFPFIILTILFLILSINDTGLNIGSTYIGTPTYYYILCYRLMIISCVMFSVNRILVDNNNNVGIGNFFVANKLLLVTLICFLTYAAIGGDRGPIFTIIVIMTFGYLVKNKMEIKYTQLLIIIVGTFALSSLFTFIEILRIEGSEKVLSFQTLEDTYITIGEYEKYSNSSQRCTLLAIDGIEQGQYSHTYGMFFIQSIIAGIPYFGNIINEAIMPFAPKGTADLLTIQNSGLNYTSGIGTTYLADLYIEFGLLGIVVISFLYGMLVSFFDNKCRRQSFHSISQYFLIAIFTGFLFYTGRGTLGGFFVYFIHTWIIYIVIKSVLMFFGVSLVKNRI